MGSLPPPSLDYFFFSPLKSLIHILSLNCIITQFCLGIYSRSRRVPNIKILEGVHLPAPPRGADIITVRAGASRMCLSKYLRAKGL